MNSPASQLRKSFNSPPFSYEVANFMDAVRRGNKDAVVAFLNKYEDAANTHDDFFSNGKTALIWAAKYGHKDIVELLLEKGADINAKDRSGWTPLMEVAMSGPFEMLEFLLERGADFDAKSNNGTTALVYAQANGIQAAVDVLEQWLVKQQKRLAEEQKRLKAELEDELKGFSRGLERPIPARRPFKIPKGG